MNTHVWRSGFLKGILSCGLSAMFLTKSRRLALPLEELTYAYVATPAYEQSVLRRPPNRHKARGRLVPTNVGISDVPRGHRTARTTGRDELLLPCSQSGALRNLCPARLEDRPCDNPHSTGNLEKKFWARGVYWLTEFPITIFKIHKISERQSIIKSASF